MNENIDLTVILKNCPEGWKFWSKVHGEVTFKQIRKENFGYPIEIRISSYFTWQLLPNGKFVDTGECLLVPSKDQQDWSKFSAPWYKDRFDPKMLKPFDKVIARIDEQGLWCCDLFSFIEEDTNLIKGSGAYYKHCIPYNDDTKHLVGTTNDVPEYYRYWEN